MGLYTGGGFTPLAPGAGLPLLLGAGLREPGRDCAAALPSVAAHSITRSSTFFFISWGKAKSNEQKSTQQGDYRAKGKPQSNYVPMPKVQPRPVAAAGCPFRLGICRKLSLKKTFVLPNRTHKKCVFIFGAILHFLHI